jgi:two-component system, LytTR family, sensor kinase
MSGQFGLTLSLLQQMCVYMFIAYLLSKTVLFVPLMQVSVRLPHKLLCYAVFSVFCIMGTYFSLPIDDSFANTRAIGAVLGGLLGGPSVGLAVGLTGGLHRYSLGGATALACMVSTVTEGLIGGLVHRYLVGRGRGPEVFHPTYAGVAAFVAEVAQMTILLAMVRPFPIALHLVGDIALPMIVTNTLGAAMFIRILLDRRAMQEKYSISFSAKALRIAARAEGTLRLGFNQDNSMRVARIIYEETGVGAVAITDREKLLAFIGIGDDHHLPGTPITSPHTYHAIQTNEVFYADGNAIPYRCSITPHCKLGSSLVIPLRGEEGRVIGTIKLYEPRTKIFASINRALGEGIAQLLSTQILAGRYEHQKQLLAQSEIKLLHAQVNPHFLFNALNTISAVIRRDPDHARELVQYLSAFFRKNLKRPSDEVTLQDELKHVNAYLQIEKARFSHLRVDIEVPEAYQSLQLPPFSLQPIVENAIKHGTSQLNSGGRILIGAGEEGEDILLWVEDNAGLYRPEHTSNGLGMSLVDRRIKGRFGERYGVEVTYEAERFTRVTIHLPRTVPTVC